MGTNLSRREQLRKKHQLEKQRKVKTTLFIILAVIVFFSLIIILPRLLATRPEYKHSQGFAMGDPDAPIKVTLFSSYSCGYCKQYADQAEPGFIKKYVETGKVYYQYVNLSSTDEASRKASAASYCAADQNQFFAYKYYLYSHSAEVNGFSPNNLIGYAKTLGLDIEKFQTCLESDTYSNAYLDDLQYAESIGVTVTPLFLVNDKLVYSNELIPTLDALIGQ